MRGEKASPTGGSRGQEIGGAPGTTAICRRPNRRGRGLLCGKQTPAKESSLSGLPACLAHVSHSFMTSSS